MSFGTVMRENGWGGDASFFADLGTSPFYEGARRGDKGLG